MADDVDHAAEISELHLQRALIAVQSAQHDAPKPTGYCLCCGDDTPSDRRWCDAGCRDLWQEEQARL